MGVMYKARLFKWNQHRESLNVFLSKIPATNIKMIQIPKDQDSYLRYILVGNSDFINTRYVYFFKDKDTSFSNHLKNNQMRVFYGEV